MGKIAPLPSDHRAGELDQPDIQRLASDVVSKMDERIAGMKVIRGYAAPVANGEMSALQDDDCHFVVEFMTALSGEKRRRRA